MILWVQFYLVGKPFFFSIFYYLATYIGESLFYTVNLELQTSGLPFRDGNQSEIFFFFFLMNIHFLHMHVVKLF